MKAVNPKAPGVSRPLARTSRGPGPVDAHIGREIRARRKAAGMSQSDLGAAVGVAYQQIQKYEKVESRISVARLIEIAKALGCKITDFIPEEDR